MINFYIFILEFVVEESVVFYHIDVNKTWNEFWFWRKELCLYVGFVSCVEKATILYKVSCSLDSQVEPL